MKAISGVKAEQLQAVTKQISSSGGGQTSQDALFKEFSTIMDKIASELTECQEGQESKKRYFDPSSVEGMFVTDQIRPREMMNVEAKDSGQSDTTLLAMSAQQMPENFKQETSRQAKSENASEEKSKEKQQEEGEEQKKVEKEGDHDQRDNENNDLGQSRAEQVRQNKDKDGDDKRVKSEKKDKEEGEKKQESKGAEKQDSDKQQNMQAQESDASMQAAAAGETELKQTSSQAISRQDKDIATQLLLKQAAGAVQEIHSQEQELAKSIAALIEKSFAALPVNPHIGATAQVKEVSALQAPNMAQQQQPPQQQQQQAQEAQLRKSEARQGETPEQARMPKHLANKTMEKVEAVLKEMSKSRDGKTISVRLDPPELGTLKIDVTLRSGVLHARLVPESPQVSLLLREQAHELQGMLRKLGLNVDKVSVAIGADRNGIDFNAFSSFSQQSNTQQGQSQQGGGVGGTGEESNVVAPAGAMLDSLKIDDHWIA